MSEPAPAFDAPGKRHVRPAVALAKGKTVSKRKTEDQIDAEITALVAVMPKVRELTSFGDDNHAAIDAQLAVLRERMSSDEVHDAYGDAGNDEFDQYTFDAALSACDWLTGVLASDEDSPAASWADAMV